MSRELIVGQTVAEYSARLGVPAPNLETLRRKGRPRRYLGTCFWDDNTIFVKTRGRDLRGIRRTVAHELIHMQFRSKVHGKAFDKYVKVLQQGNIFFDGRGLRE